MSENLEFRLQIEGPGVSQEILIPQGIFTIGRQPGNNLVLDSRQITRYHARIECSASECQIIDLDSANGTFLNGNKLIPQVPFLITPEDSILIGPFTLRVRSSLASAEIAPAAVEGPPAGAKRTPVFLAPPEMEGTRIGDDIRDVGKPPPPVVPSKPPAPSNDWLPPGLSLHSERLLNYLPGIYHTDFMGRFLGIFESILTPIEWNINNFDLYLDPGTAPATFLPWLSNWFNLSWGADWSEEKRRAFLQDAYQLYSRMGTRWALSKVLEIYTGKVPEIIDQGENLAPFTFLVRLPMNSNQVNRLQVEALINAWKPVHTAYSLEFA